MNHAGLCLVDIEVLLANCQQHGNVFGRDDVPLAEHRSLALAGDDARDVLAEHAAHGVFHPDGLHAETHPQNSYGRCPQPDRPKDPKGRKR